MVRERPYIEEPMPTPSTNPERAAHLREIQLTLDHADRLAANGNTVKAIVKYETALFWLQRLLKHCEERLNSARHPL